VLTPHVAGYSADSMQRYLAEAVDNCRRLRDGQPLAHWTTFLESSLLDGALMHPRCHQVTALLA
jgi:phosphoglycerate dehydrogenase-like enzyme